MSSSRLRLVDKRYLISAFVDSASGSDIVKFQSGLDFDGGGNNKTERATGIINHIFDQANTDELVIDLLNFLFVERPHVDLSDSNRSYRELKAKVLDVRGLELTDDGFQFQTVSSQRERHGNENKPGSPGGGGPTRQRDNGGLPVLQTDHFDHIRAALDVASNPDNVARQASRSKLLAETAPPVAPSSERSSLSKPANDVVFVVHGRDMRPVEALDQFLGFLNLRMMSWSDAVRLTGVSQPHTYDIVKAGMDGAAAVIVIFSPDDEARTQRPFAAAGESQDFMGQARQNVLVEAGMAFATSRKRTIFLQSAPTRPITDLEGFNWVKMNGEWDSRADLINRLELADVNPKPRYPDLMHRTAGPFKVGA